ncbi:MAG: hypothetical protein Q8J62_02135 [Candidatus Cloacimonadaceae bacterium]|nr:hypothetical protein [Candidatus Cloacimonadaceae bacterium]
MKKIMIIAAFCIFIFALSAQTGLFDLSYGMDYRTCMDILEENGFRIYDANDNIAEFAALDNLYVESIGLVLDPADDTLAGWYVIYIPQKEENIEDIVLAALVSHHGEDILYDNESGNAAWVLDGNRHVDASWDEYGNFYMVVYWDNSKLNLFTY